MKYYIKVTRPDRPPLYLAVQLGVGPYLVEADFAHSLHLTHNPEDATLLVERLMNVTFPEYQPNEYIIEAIEI